VLDYERQLSEIRDKQKKMIALGVAIRVDSHSDKKIVAILAKLMLRAFNSECDAMLERVDYRNIVTFENRIQKAYEQINKIVEGFQKHTELFNLEISSTYYQLKIDELRIIHEFQEKKEEEAEKQRQMKEIMRDELKAQKDLEKAQQDAEKEERIYGQALEKALAEARAASGAKQEQLMEKVAVLEAQLREAQEKKQRAISQAELTKTGNVYIISNIGAFGENVYKIGMTRRLEPMERIYELGDASVPFSFDVHAMIQSENAPELERQLHIAFAQKQLNRVNPRKEFFRINWNELETVVKKHDQTAVINRIAEAKEYRMSLAMIGENAPDVISGPFKFNCPECGRRLEADETMASLEINCPICQKLITVPENSSNEILQKTG
jgi:hypothetical protein